MASSNLREELICPVCWDIYIDPVSLKCGHSFCQDCITRQLITQKGSGCYSCPQCKEESQEWPALHRNIALRNISEHFLSKPSLGNQQCSIHKLDLKYYCAQDAACICEKCSEDEHQGHQVETLDEASEKKKEKIKNIHQKLMTEIEEMENRAKNLEESMKKVEEKMAVINERVISLFKDLRRQLDDLEKRALSEISMEAEQVSVLVSNLIDKLVIKKGEISRKICDVQRELCNMTYPLTVLQDSDTCRFCDTEDGYNDERERQEAGDIDVAGINHMLHIGLSHIIEVTACFYLREPADLLLDVNTAHNDLHISDDLKTASYSPTQNHPKSLKRFQDYTQVISIQNFSSGRHYWEVDVRGSEYWSIGMCYPSIDRGGYNSQIECNERAWCLRRTGDRYFVIHDSNRSRVPDNISADRVRIYLDYGTGQISFYALCDPMRQLHTFTATFIEPLHVALRIWNGCITISRGNREI
ncbi:nuclear factor 7, brain-like [Mantella aurantiaca]